MPIVMASRAYEFIELVFINHLPLKKPEWAIPLATARPSAEPPTRLEIAQIAVPIKPLILLCLIMMACEDYTQQNGSHHATRLAT
jgi:hypothetical protein